MNNPFAKKADKLDEQAEHFRQTAEKMAANADAMRQKASNWQALQIEALELEAEDAPINDIDEDAAIEKANPSHFPN